MVGKDKVHTSNVTRTYLKIQDSTSNPNDLDKRQMCSEQYYTPVLVMVKMWNQLREQARNRQQSVQVTSMGRSGKPKTSGVTESIGSLKCIHLSISKESKDKVKSSEGSGIETDQAEQLDVLLNQSTKVLNKHHDTDETDASITSKWDRRPLSPYSNKDTQTEIIMAEKVILIQSILNNNQK